jgi:putative transposase
MSLPQRKRPAQGVLDSDEIPTLVFLTVCTDNRHRWLANHETHQLLRDIWLEATAWAVGTYVLMPDHLHLFAWPYQPVTRFDKWVRYWKSQFTRRSTNRCRRWQPNCFHHRIRSSESAGRVASPRRPYLRHYRYHELRNVRE